VENGPGHDAEKISDLSRGLRLDNRHDYVDEIETLRDCKNSGKNQQNGQNQQQDFQTKCRPDTKAQYRQHDGCVSHPRSFRLQF